MPDPQRAQVQVPLGRSTFEGARLDDLIVVAYSDDLSWIRNQPPRSVVLGGPDWVHSDLFDVEAIAENPPVVSAGDLHQILGDKTFAFNRDLARRGFPMNASGNSET